MKRVWVILTLMVLAVINSCKTDFDVNAPYKDIAIVYGLLNQDSSASVKISKAFLGEGNAMTYARAFDSTNYDPAEIEAKVEEYDGDLLIRTISLTAVLVNKDPGIFGDAENPRQYIYKDLTNKKLNEDYNYKLVIHNKKTNKVITGQTGLIHDFSVAYPQMYMARYRNSLSFLYDQNLQWVSAENGRVYQIVLRYHYSEFNMLTKKTSEKSADWNLPLIATEKVEAGNLMNYKLDAKQLYVILSSKIPVDNNVYRRPGKIDYFFMVGSDDLYNYIEINKPSYSVVQERPDYSNISNGMGIFSSRYIKKITQYLNKYSTDTLIYGYYTKNLRFYDTINFNPTE
jgi:hypothetical protein